MPGKVFQVQVELCLHSVTCPGVWLCPSGKLSLQLYMLDACVQTSSVETVFPLYFEEQFVFCKQFTKPQRLSDLQKALAKECFYVELIQWTSCTIGNVLATFITSLSDVLFPAKIEGVYTGIPVDLLMEPSDSFPGIIAPKIEITTKTTVEERLCPQQHNKCNAFVVTPKLVTSHLKTRPPFLHQKKVCHSYCYHKSRNIRCDDRARNFKPPFVYKKPEEELLARKPKGLDRNEPICKCKSEKGDLEAGSTDVTDDFVQNFYTRSKKRRAIHATGSKINCHSHEDCPVCAKYSNFFDRVCSSKPKLQLAASQKSSYKCECSTSQLNDTRSHKNENKSNVDLKVSRTCSCCQTQSVPAVKKAVEMSASNDNCNCSEESSTSSSCCCSTKVYRSGGYHRKFYDSLEKFYDNLYKKTQEKASNARNLNVCY